MLTYEDAKTLMENQISHHFRTLNWLPLRSMIQYRTLCTIHHQYFQAQHTPMVPPLLFGRQYQYATHTYHTTVCPATEVFSQRFFISQATHWWNAVPNDILTSPTFRDNLFFLFVREI